MQKFGMTFKTERMPEKWHGHFSFKVPGTELWGVDIVHTFDFGTGHTGLGSARIPHVFAGSQDLYERECGSSPTSGTAYPLVRGVFALTGLR